MSGRKQYAKSAGVDAKLVAEVERQLGPKWFYILSKGNSYSGLSIANLARAAKYRMDHWYDTVYFFQSRMVHSSAAVHHIEDSASGASMAQWLSPLRMVRGTLQTGTLMFLIALTILTDQIDFGVAATSVMASFRREYLELFNIE